MEFFFAYMRKNVFFLDMIITLEYYRKSKAWKTSLWFNFLPQLHICTWKAHCWFIIKLETQINKTLAVSDWLLWCGRNKCCVVASSRHAMRTSWACHGVLGWDLSLWVPWLVIETQCGIVALWLVKMCCPSVRLLGMVLSKLWQVPEGAHREPVLFFVVQFTSSVTHRSVARLNLACFQLLACRFSMYYSKYRLNISDVICFKYFNIVL